MNEQLKTETKEAFAAMKGFEYHVNRLINNPEKYMEILLDNYRLKYGENSTPTGQQLADFVAKEQRNAVYPTDIL